MSRLTARERRLLALGLLVLVLATAWRLAVEPVLNGFSARRAERVELVADLLRDQLLARRFPRLRAQKLALARDAPAYAFQTADPAAARSAGETRLAGAVAAAGGVLHAVRQQSTGSGQQRLRADAALTLPELVRLLASLRVSRPYAVVEGLNVAAGDAPAGQAPAPLEVRLDVIYAYAAAG